MALFRCGKCGFIKEVPEKHMDKVAKCPQCSSESRVVDTLSFVEKIIASYSKKQNEVADSKKSIIQLQEKISQYSQALDKAKIYINTQKERYKRM